MKACIDHRWLRRENCCSIEDWIPAFAGMTESGWPVRPFHFGGMVG